MAFTDHQETSSIPLILEVFDRHLECVNAPKLVYSNEIWEKDFPAGPYLFRILTGGGATFERSGTVADDSTIRLDFNLYTQMSAPIFRALMLRDSQLLHRDSDLNLDLFKHAWIRQWVQSGTDWDPKPLEGIVVHRDDSSVCYRVTSKSEARYVQVGGPNIRWQMVPIPAECAVDLLITPRDASLDLQVISDDSLAEAFLSFLRNVSPSRLDLLAPELLTTMSASLLRLMAAGNYIMRVDDPILMNLWLEAYQKVPQASVESFTDVQIVSAWLQISLARANPSESEWRFAEARETLVKAARSGHPLYTDSLRLLLTGLELFREERLPGDDDLEQLVADVSIVAASADYASVTLKLFGLDPVSPSPHPVTGIPVERETAALLHQVWFSDLIYFGWVSADARIGDVPSEAMPTDTPSVLQVIGPIQPDSARLLEQSSPAAGMISLVENPARHLVIRNSGAVTGHLARIPGGPSIARIVEAAREPYFGDGAEYYSEDYYDLEEERLLRVEAAFGDVNKMVQLGVKLKERDRDAAEFWLRIAVEKGDDFAMYNLALIIESSDPREASRLFEQAAAAGVAQARIHQMRIRKKYSW